ncbi:unnamed protein product [Urochloa humidicola]
MEASHGHQSPSSSETLMAALLNVPASQLPSLARALAADARRLRCRLALLLLSPPHFARALARLRSMPLHAKAALLGRALLRSLLLLLPALCPGGDGGGGWRHHHLLLRQPDLDAAILLLAMCDSYSPAAAAASSSSSSPVVDWRAVIVDDVVATALSVSGLGCGGGAAPWAALAPHVDAAARCRRFADAVSSSSSGAAVAAKDGEGSGGAAHAAVLALPDAAGDGAPCAICWDVMLARGGGCGGGAGVCALRPCGHRFHWRCALRWLARRNTCPCCRAELPAQDAAAETRRLWRAVERVARGG